MSCLLPVFPKLFIEAQLKFDDSAASQVNENEHRQANHQFDFGLGTCLVEVLSDPDLSSMFPPSTCLSISRDVTELTDGGAIGLILFILSRCLRLHKHNQYDLMQIGGIQMIEYSLQNIPNHGRLLREETDQFIMALLQLRSAAQDCHPLERSITQRLLCNFSIWSAASFAMQVFSRTVHYSLLFLWGGGGG